jgi:hypothetical protein
MENPPISSEDTPRVRGRDFVSWASGTEFVSEVRQFRETAYRIIESSGVSTNKVREFEQRFFVGGVNRQALKEEINGKKIFRKLRKKLHKISPMTLRRLSKLYVPPRLLRFTGWEGYDLDTMCKSLKVRGTRFSRTELEHVRELSLKLDRQIRLETSE